ncbi:MULTISPECIES: flagellar hook-basal body complex protein [unclassified Helicobacter]|uniref:flagellar hook-basal body complex protein n=1 Tax=unclassified Helicobacter TaxID=2593540 RepID=UPI000CF1C021|nr:MULTISPECIES: flagellar hook-basal body complex protein [unclassified Helicobacter]
MNNTILNSYSGIKTHQFGLDSVSNNIANVNTLGYRENIPEFKSLLSQHIDSINSNTVSSDSNFGVSASSNAISTKNGNYKPSDGEFDVAYSGKGWFVVGKNQNGSMTINEDGYEANQSNFFTRDGSFSRDADGYIVNASGYYLYGVDLGKIKGQNFENTNSPEEDLKALSANTLKPLRIPQDLHYQPTETKKVDIALNLNPTQNPASLQDFLFEEDGSFNQENLDNLDLNTLFNFQKEPLDARVNNDIRITIKQGEESKEVTLKYGNDGASNNQFKTFKDLKELLKAQTGLDLDISRDNQGNPSKPISLEIKNPLDTIQLTLGGKFIDKLGLNTADLEMRKDDKQATNPLYVGAFVSNSEIFDEDGEKFILQTKFFLHQTGNKEENQKWITKTAIFDKSGETMVSKEHINGAITFDSDNKASADPIEIDFKDSKITYSFAGAKDKTTTNYNYQDSGILKTDTDGRPKGKMMDLKIDENGIITLFFDNGESAPMGRIGITAFINDQGLKKVGGNLFEISQATNNQGDNKILSGAPILGWDENNNGQLKFGKVMHKYLETSNTDVTSALTNLILMQRGYSMNAKAFGTGDDLIKEAINLKK